MGNGPAEKYRVPNYTVITINVFGPRILKVGNIYAYTKYMVQIMCSVHAYTCSAE